MAQGKPVAAKARLLPFAVRSNTRPHPLLRICETAMSRHILPYFSLHTFANGHVLGNVPSTYGNGDPLHTGRMLCVLTLAGPTAIDNFRRQSDFTAKD